MAGRRPPSGAPAVAARLADPALTARHELVAWIQWRLATELTDAAEAAAPCALIGDLAVGCSPDGADAWIHQDLFAHGVHIGAPPDPFNDAGQLWGLPPLVPWRLREARYAPFIALLRAGFAGVRGLRIDHVMGLFRQFWVPDGGTAADGAYVYLPRAELLALVCLEAHRAGGFVIGEDLGTVEPEVRAAMAEAGMLGTKVWMFDQDVEEWPEPNLGTVTTHDLPTSPACGPPVRPTSASRSSSSPATMRRCSTCSSPRTARSLSEPGTVRARHRRRPRRIRRAAEQPRHDGRAQLVPPPAGTRRRPGGPLPRRRHRRGDG